MLGPSVSRMRGGLSVAREQSPAVTADPVLAPGLERHGKNLPERHVGSTSSFRGQASDAIDNRLSAILSDLSHDAPHADDDGHQHPADGQPDVS